MAGARPLKLVAAIAVGSVLAGCAPAQKRLYYWEGFQGQLYEYFKADNTFVSDETARQSRSSKPRRRTFPSPRSTWTSCSSE